MSETALAVHIYVRGVSPKHNKYEEEKFVKKFLAIVLALACVLSLCACGGQTGSNGEGSGEGGDRTADGKVKLSIGLPSSALVLSHENNALTKWLEETCNIEIKFVEYAGGTDMATQISTTISARQELPDILWGMNLGDSLVNRYGKDGYFIDLSDYFAEKDGASKIFWDRMANELSEADQDLVLRSITAPETGAIYGVPTIETSLTDKMQFQPWINQVWLDKLQLEAPTNCDELVTVLKAFKTQDPNGNGMADEIPLFGSQLGYGSKVVDWLINMFCYYNVKRVHNVGKDGKLYPVYTTDEYREALKFVKMLYDEELLTSLAWSATGQEMKTIITPVSGTALCGIFLGHLTSSTATNNDVLFEYVPLKNWGYVVRNDLSCNLGTFITDTCKNPDKAFEVLMTMWSWDGAMRIRYGEYGVNWTDPDPGAKSDMGLDATYKLIRDPLFEQSTAKWSQISSTFNNYAELETAQVAEQTDPWYAKRTAMAAEQYKLFAEQEAAKNDPSMICPLLVYTEEEQERTSMVKTNVSDRRTKAQTEFCTGILDPNSDADWNAYIKQLEDLGLAQVLESCQTSYDRGI